MIKDVLSFFLKLVAVTIVLFVAHWYILEQLYTEPLYFPLRKVYFFNAALVLGMYFLLRYYGGQRPKSVLKIFLLLSVLKMAFVIVFLLPLFLGRANDASIEVINFFIPYFVLLVVEILAMNKFLQKA